MYKLLGLLGTAFALDIYLGNIPSLYTTPSQLPPSETSSVAMPEPSPRPSSDIRDFILMVFGGMIFATGTFTNELAHVYKTIS